MSSTPREIGTLVVVVLKAQHLPNKRHIGKQDPYCVVSINGEKRRTKAIKRGGQHPEWDEEIRFTLFEDTEDVLERTARGDGTPPPPPPKDSKGPKKIKGGKIMKLSCYADDPREPDLIGEADVDLTEVLTNGETDEWFTLMYKDKFSGRVYLELTWWLNEPPPKKKAAGKAPKPSKQYGGPGVFTPSGETQSPIGGTPNHSRIVSANGIYEHSRNPSDALPPSLRASSSLAKLDLYVPPYEQQSHATPVDHLINEFGEFGVTDQRESLPSSQSAYGGPTSSTGFSTFNTQHSNSWDQSSTYLHDRPLTPNQPTHQQPTSVPSNHSPYSSHTPYHPAYENGSPSPYTSTIRAPRHSVPASSSGFVPLSNPSGFASVDSPAFIQPSSTPAPTVYNQSFIPQQNFIPLVSQTPIPTATASYIVSPTSYIQQAFPTSQSVPFSQYPPPNTGIVPTHQYVASPPLTQTLPPPQTYQTYPNTPSPSHDNISTQYSQPNNLSSSFGASSRPLPQQPPVYVPPSTQTSFSTNSPVGGNSSPQGGNGLPLSGGYQSDAPPPNVYNTTNTQGYGTSVQLTSSNSLPLPPPPPPPQFVGNGRARRQSTLPQPPVLYQQLPYPPPPPPPPPPLSSTFHNQPLPPPPPPPTTSFANIPPPPPLSLADKGPSYHPGPLPQPPVQVQTEQWQTSSSVQPSQNDYHSQPYN